MNGAEKFPYAEYADPVRHPLLTIAARNGDPAHSYKVEWLEDRFVGSRVTQEVGSNYCQIVRTPFSPRDDTDRDKWSALEQHLDDVEEILWNGLPSYDRHPHPRGTCGGVLHFLGREPIHEDTIRLRPLQDLVLLLNRGMGANVVHEFLSEFSLEVRPAPTIRRYRKPSPPAYAQGSVLAA